MEKRGNTCKIKKVIILWIVSVLLFMAVAPQVYAIDLVDEDSSAYQEIYVSGSNDTPGGTQAEEAETNEVGPLEELLSVLFAGLAEGLNALLVNGQIDLSIDAIIYGRVESNVTVDIAHFGLEENNPYGIFGASLYYILRDFAFAVIPVVVLIMLIIQFFHNTQKGRARLKEVISNAVVFFVVMIILPYLLELYIYMRDVCMYITGNGFAELLTSLNPNSIDLGSSVFDRMRQNYNGNRTLVNGIFLLAASTSGLFYLWDYVKIACLVALTFGLFPVLLVIRFFKPRILQDWMDIVLPSLAVPFIDMVLFMIPTIISAVYMAVLGTGAGEFAIGVVMLCCIWAARPIRDKVLQKFFGFDGSVRGGGSPVMAMMMLARAFGAKGGSKDGGADRTSTGAESLEKAAEQKEFGEALVDADRRIDSMKVPDMPERVSMGSEDNGVEQFLKEQEEAAELATADAEELVEKGGMGNSEMSAINDSVDTIDGMEGIENVDDVGVVLGEAPDAVADMEELSEGMDAVSAEEMAKIPAEEGAEPLDSGVVSGVEDSVTDTVGTIGNVDSVGGTSRMALSDVVIPSSQDSPSYSKYVNSDTFAGMSERDKKRFHNLSKMDALGHSIRKNEQIMAKAGYTESGFEEKYSSEKSNNVKLRQTEERLLTARNQISDTSSDAYRKADVSYQRAVELRQGSDERLVHMENAQQAAYENKVYSQHVEHCKSVESAYARNSERVGMSGRTYYDADDYYHTKTVEAITKKQADFRNFESGKFDSILSPQEKEEFYRQRSVYQERERVVRTAATVGGVAAGVIGGTLTMYGGPNTMGMGAALGYGLGRNVVTSSGMTLAGEGLSEGNSDNKREDASRVVSERVDIPKKSPVRSEGDPSFDQAYEKVNRQADRARREVEG